MPINATCSASFLVLGLSNFANISMNSRHRNLRKLRHDIFVTERSTMTSSWTLLLNLNLHMQTRLLYLRLRHQFLGPLQQQVPPSSPLIMVSFLVTIQDLARVWVYDEGVFLWH
jgi:hypothetical protein